SEIGVSRSRMSTIINQLIDAGFLVLVSRGGFLRQGEPPVPNIYAIPGKRGSLDAVARERRQAQKGKAPTPPARWIGRILPLPAPTRATRCAENTACVHEKDAGNTAASVHERDGVHAPNCLGPTLHP